METVEVVIRLPKEVYENIQKIDRIIVSRRNGGKTIEFALWNGVKNGTVLPKGHGDLKDYDAIKSDYIRKISVFMSEEERMDLLCTIVDEAEAVIKADREEDRKK